MSSNSPHRLEDSSGSAKGNPLAPYRRAVMGGAALISALLAALHAPGQISVDSGVALYEGVIGRAVGWGPSFFAAVLSWLGGGVVGASVFVALNCVATYGLFSVVLGSSGSGYRLAPRWRIALATLLALNPLFMFYAGIVWKDVLLATVAASVVVLLLAAARWPRRRAIIGLLCASLLIAALPLLRQQGILFAAPLAILAAWMVARRWGTSAATRAAAGIGSLASTVALCGLLSWSAAATVAPLPASPVSVGILTIRAYDIMGMVAYANPDDPSAWTGASGPAIRKMRTRYSSERIDTIWNDPDVRGYINGLSEAGSASVWKNGIKHDPLAYLTHRASAFSSLIGVGPRSGCVPAYWGVAAIPEHLAAVGLVEEMDPRDRLLGRTIKQLEDSIIFRHWAYVVLLLAVSVVLVRRSASEEVWVLRAGALTAWIYLASFGPTTIACDFRYLYPVSLLATILAMHILVRGGEAPRAAIK